MKTVRGTRRSTSDSARSRGFIEALESRCLLSDGALSAVVGDKLFYVSTNGRELWKSELDGSEATKIKSWITGKGPVWLTGVDDMLFFSAGAAPTSSGSGRELWKSDGLEAGTTLVRDIHSGNQASDPRELVEVNDHIMFIAQGNSYTSIFSSDGTWDGTIALIGRSNYYLPTILEVMNDRLYADLYNGDLGQKEWWQSDGTKAGSELVTGARLNTSNVLEIFGGSGDSTSVIVADGANINVTINGLQQHFAAAEVTGIEAWGQQGKDNVLIDPAIAINVTLNGNAGDDSLQGGSGNDAITDSSGNNWLNGGGGNDSLNIFSDGGIGVNTLIGGEGDDVLHLAYQSGAGMMIGGPGNDTITGRSGHDWIDGGDGNDTIFMGDGTNTASGGAGDDALFGGDGDDLIFGNDGNDYIAGWGGEDTLDGGSGADTLEAWTGLDSIISDAEDIVTDREMVNTTTGLFEVGGTHGDDIIEVRLKSGNAAVVQAIVNGQVFEFASLPISKQMVRVVGGNGNDRITFDLSIGIRPSLIGGLGNDTLISGMGSDTIIPGLGNDVIDGGAGDDTLWYRERTERLLKLQEMQRIIRTDAGEVDIFANIEELTLGSGDDVIRSNRAADGLNQFELERGNDSAIVRSTMGMALATIYGGDGDDTLVGSTQDSISGGNGTNTIIREPLLPPVGPGTRPAARTPFQVISLVM